VSGRLAENPCAGDNAGSSGPSFGLAKMLKVELKKRSECHLCLIPRTDETSDDDEDES
jgi:hypothetical protein